MRLSDWTIGKSLIPGRPTIHNSSLDLVRSPRRGVVYHMVVGTATQQRKVYLSLETNINRINVFVCAMRLLLTKTCEFCLLHLLLSSKINTLNPSNRRSCKHVRDKIVVSARGKRHISKCIAPGGIALVASKAARRNGEAVIRLTASEQRELALKKHMNQRYIEIYALNFAEFSSVAGGEWRNFHLKYCAGWLTLWESCLNYSIQIYKTGINVSRV